MKTRRGEHRRDKGSYGEGFTGSTNKSYSRPAELTG